MMKQMKKTLCLLLALVMLLSLSPVSAFAEGETSVCTEHVYGEDGLCTVCGAEKPADPPACTEHVYGEDGLCTVCGAEKPVDPPVCTEHVYGEDGLCTICGAEKPVDPPVCTEHVYGEDGHCTVCGAEKPADPPVCTEHVYGEDGLCTVCGAEKPADPPACTEHVYGEDGHCTVCGAEKPAETVTETVPEVEYTMQSFNFRADAGTEITVDAPEGAFPEGTKLTVREEQDLTELQALIDADEELEGVIVAAADISFYYHDEKIQPLVPVYVSYASAAAAEAEEPKLIHIADDDSIDVLDEVKAETVEAGSQAMQAMSGFGAAAETPASTEMLKLSFQAGSFSRYAILGAAKAPVQPLGEEPTEPSRDGETEDGLSISGSWPSGESYVMADTQDKGFSISYKASNGVNNRVLVVRGLEYGAAFAALPGTDNDVAEVASLDAGAGDNQPRIVLIRLKNTGAAVDYSASFTLKHVVLTSSQAVALMDNGMLNTEISVAEYEYDSSLPLNRVLEDGSQVGTSAVLWSGKPAADLTNTVTATHTYKVSVTPVSYSYASPSNWMLGQVGYHNGNIYMYFQGNMNGEPRFQLPGAYNEGGALVEVKSIRFYVPDEKLKLTGIGNTSPHNFEGCARDLVPRDFTQEWGNWTVGPRTLDEDTGKSYYELTPKSRVFNTNTKDLTAFYGGMVLTFQLVNAADPLEPNTVYRADLNDENAKTLFRYRLPGDTEDRVASFTSPEVNTYEVRDRGFSRSFGKQDWWYGAWAWAWDMFSDESHEVTVGSILRDKVFNYLYNSSYVMDKIHYLPKYTGGVTQSYTFPYQIQPLTLKLYQQAQSVFNSNVQKSVLSSVSYTTYEGESGSLTEEEIQTINNKIRANSENIGTYTFPEGVHVKTLSLVWEKLVSELRWWEFWAVSNKGDIPTLRVDFDFKVNNFTDVAETEKLPNGSWVQVVYRESFDQNDENAPADFRPPTVNGANGTSRAGRSEEQLFWFRLRDPICPDLYTQGYWPDCGGDYNAFPISYLDSGTGTLGHVGFYIGQYGERRTTVKNPEIVFSMTWDRLNWDRGWSNDNYYRRTPLDGIDQSDLLFFLDGSFNVTSKLYNTADQKGWTFTWTTLGSDEVHTYTVQEGDVGQRLHLLGPDEYFTSFKLSYDGDADTSHNSESDTSTVKWLMTDIGYRRLNVNPRTGAAIRVRDEYNMTALTLLSKVCYDDCNCVNHTHSRQHEKWQNATVPLGGTGGMFPVPPRAWLYSSRAARLSLSGNYASTGVSIIYQGESVSTDYNLKQDFFILGPRGNYYYYYIPDDSCSAFYNRGSTNGWWIPWGEIHEAAYIELMDPEFIPDLANTTFCGYAANSAQVVTDLTDWIQKKDESGSPVFDDNGEPVMVRYLKLRLADGVVRRSAATSINVYETLKIAFKTVPGTEYGDHHPIGDIYWDVTKLLDYYRGGDRDANGNLISTGYDYDRTKYYFGGAVADPYAGTADALSPWTGAHIPAEHLFKLDGSAFTVKVDYSMQAGADLNPGKMTSYDFVNRHVVFYPGEEEQLNALLTLKGNGNNSSITIYDFNSYVVLPRVGTVIHWKETVGSGENQHQEDRYTTGEWDLFLRGAPTVISNNTNPLQSVTVGYTTEPNPTEASSYTTTAPTTPEGWAAVTGLRFQVEQIQPTKSINIQLNLRSNSKEDLDVKKAFAGGSFKYKEYEDAPEYRPGTLPLNEWDYENIQIRSGRVFWDLYDENGTRNGNNNTEPYINGVTVTLYDADGTQIDQQVTANSSGGSNANDNGVFPALRTYKADAGQYIVIENPTVTDGSTVKLTKKSTSAPIQSATDSDFVRDTNTLILGALLPNGLTNISAGFVKLPEIGEIADVTIPVGQTVDNIAAVLREYVSNTSYDANNILTNGGYRIDFSVPEGSDAIATLSPSAIEKQDNDHIRSLLSVTGVAPGSFLCTVTGKNSLGDEVSTSFTITVVPNVFYVYHSSSGTVDTISMTDPRFTSDGKFDLTVLTAGGHRYGGYYNSFADLDASCFTGGVLNAGKTLRTYTGDKATYSGLKSYWKSANAITSEPGNAMTPVRGGLYFLKEVPEKYLCSRIQYVYDWNQGNKLNSIYLLTAVDDKLYENVGFDVVVVDRDVKYATLAGSFTFKPRNTDSYIQTKVTDFAGVKRGYVGFVDGGFATTDGFLSANMQFSMTPFWTTPDGVKVSGAARSFNTGDGTCDSGTGIHEVP